MSSFIPSSPTLNPPYDIFTRRILPLLQSVYDEDTAQSLLDRIYAHLAPLLSKSLDEDLGKWSQDNILLITYGDSIRREGETPLVTLGNFLRRYLKDTITGVHILPFCPYIVPMMALR